MQPKRSWCSLLAICVLAATAWGGAASADAVIDWNNVTLDAVRDTPLNPPIATRLLALVHVAIYDAVSGVDRLYTPYLVTRSAPPGTSAEAAAVYAAHHVLVDQLPGLRADFDAALAASLAEVPAGPARNKARAWGRHVARKVLKLRRDDGWDRVVAYTPSGELGRWQPTPPRFAPALLPGWGLVTPWAMAGAEQFLPPETPPLDSAEFAAAFNEVKDLGRVDSPVRTADQTEIAYFWEDGVGSVTPPGHWFVIAQSAAAAFGNDLDENARLFALLAITNADAAIAVWFGKFYWDHVRPVTNIQLEADIDGNPDTEPDPTWLPELPTPPFPAYTSGHSGFSQGSATLLALFFGTDDHTFCGESPDPERWPDHLPGVVRCWASFSEASAEAGQSRIYGGIHWQYDNQESLVLGSALAQHVFSNVLTPLP